MNINLGLGLGALVVAAVFVFFVPNAAKVEATTGITFIIARWFHSLVWVLLAVSFFMRATEKPMLVAWANPVAALGGLTYLVFMVTFLQLK